MIKCVTWAETIPFGFIFYVYFNFSAKKKKKNYCEPKFENSMAFSHPYNGAQYRLREGLVGPKVP